MTQFRLKVGAIAQWLKAHAATPVGMYGLIGVWATVGAVGTIAQWSLFQRVEYQTQTLFFQLRGAVAPPPEIVIVAIDEESLQQGRLYNQNPGQFPFLEPLQTWPWRRSAYAQSVEQLIEAGARSVSLDLVFDLQSSYGALDDQALYEVLQRYPQEIVLAALYEPSETPQGPLLQFVAPDRRLQAPALSMGTINYLLEPDGRIHRLHQAYRRRVVVGTALRQDIPAFAAATLQAAQINYPQPRGEQIFFYGPAQSFTTIPFFWLVDPNHWNGPLLQGGRFFRNKVVLVGPTATSLQDIQPTPFTLQMPGVEVHANAIATLLENRSIREALPHPGLQALGIAVSVMAAGVLLVRGVQHPVVRLLATVVLVLLWATVSYWSFTAASVIVPTAVPIGAIALMGLSHFILAALRDRQEKRLLRQTFERYVAAPIVREILQQPQDYHRLLAGRRLSVAVLFSDIRGFTQLTLELPPEQLVQQLNAYFDRMVEAILTFQGTLDKFVGDAVMAEFGSPVSQGEKQDALNAIRAALHMRQALADLRQQWQQSGQPLLFHGIGISFGEVLAGNIGSQHRLEYAVIGDTVNVASRVEGLTKQLGTDILITAALYERVQDEVEVMPMGTYPLRGRHDQPVELFSVIGLKGQDPSFYQQVQQELHNYFKTTGRFSQNGDR